MPGLRGVGKTVVLSQLYNHHKLKKEPFKIYISLDSLAARNINYSNIVEAIEAKVGSRIYELQRKLFLFIDEVHFWSDWPVGLKVIYDSCPNLFLICTGSSALGLNLNADSGRRADIIRVPPLGLTESILMDINSGQADNLKPAGRSSLGKVSQVLVDHIESDIPQQIQQIIFGSKTASSLLTNIKQIQAKVSNYWSSLEQSMPHINSKDVAKIIIQAYTNHYLSLPDAIIAGSGLKSGPAGFSNYNLNPDPNQIHASDNGSNKGLLLAKERIQQTLGLALERDLSVFNHFDQNTLMATFDFLRLLANSDTISLNKISSNLSPDRSTKMAINTIRDLLRALCQAEILNEIKPLRSSFGRITKTSKYLFSSPAIRAALLPLPPKPATGRPKATQSFKDQLDQGRLLEDTIGMYLKRLFADQSLPQPPEYDARAGGADFVISRLNQQVEPITIEVGWNKQKHHQIIQTRKRLHKSPYGLVLTTAVAEPKLIKSDAVVYIPVSTFLMI